MPILSDENVVPPTRRREERLGEPREGKMILTIALLLALAAFGVTIAAAMNRAPLWVAVLLLTVLALIKALPPL